MDEGVLTQTGLPSADKYLAKPPRWNSQNPPRGSGTYRIHSNTLYLKYDSGQKETVQIYLLSQDVSKKPVPEIYLAGFTFERK